MEPIYYILIFVVVALALGLGLGLGLEKKKDEGGTSETVRWVAVGDDLPGGTRAGNLMYSTDGINWQISTGTSFATNAAGVAYGTSSDGTTPLWVAAGSNTGDDNNNLLYSTDGINWQISTGASFTINGNGVAYGTSSDGTTPLWVAGGNNVNGGPANNNLIYSTDGINWQISTGESFYSNSNSVAYGTSSDGTTPLWVAGGSDTGGGNNNLMYSTDGISWQISTGESFIAQCFGVAYGTSSDGTTPLWVAAGSDTGDDNNNLMYSTDGISWQISTGASFSSNGTGVAYGTSSDGTTPLWVAAGDNNNGIPANNNLMYSTDGINWQISTGASFSSNGTGVAYGTRSDGTTPLWVATGSDTGDDNNNLLYSTDGKNWTVSSSTGESFAISGSDVASITQNPALP